MIHKRAAFFVFITGLFSLILILEGLSYSGQNKPGISNVLADAANQQFTPSLSPSKIISDSAFVFLPILLKPDPEMQWVIECAACPTSFWRTTDRSLQLDSNGYPHIAYGGNDLFYTWFDGNKWQTETVDTTLQNGYSPALALDDQNQPHISYAMYNYSVTPSPYEYNQIKYAHRTNSGWDIQTLNASLPYSSETSIFLDSAANPHIGYYDQSTEHYIYMFRESGQWVSQVLSFGGEQSSLVLDTADQPHIIYCNNYVLSYTYWTGSLWDKHQVDSCQRNISFALDSADLPYISYIMMKIII